MFIGPNDLAASLGHPGNSEHPLVQEAIDRVKGFADEAGEPTGIFGQNEDDARRRIAQGYRFVSIGTNIGLLLTDLSSDMQIAGDFQQGRKA